MSCCGGFPVNGCGGNWGGCYPSYGFCGYPYYGSYGGAWGYSYGYGYNRCFGGPSWGGWGGCC